MVQEESDEYFLRLSKETGIAVNILKNKWHVEPEPNHAIKRIKSEVPVLKPKQYNLRRKSELSNRNYVTNDKFGLDSFKDKALAIIDVDNYHSLTPKDQYSEKILTLSKLSQRPQLDCFIFESKAYFVMTWLSVARIFEFNDDERLYSEVKRIPERHITLSPEIILCVHYSDKKFYLAHITDQQCNEDKVCQIDAKDIHGHSIQKPCFYPHIIKSVYSDDTFVYVLTTTSTVYLHQKAHFNFAVYPIDFTPMTKDPPIFMSAKFLKSVPHTKIQVFLTTPTKLLLTYYDAISHSLRQSYDFNPDYTTISTKLHHHLIIILRTLNCKQSNSQYTSMVEFGRVVICDKDDYFVHLASVSLKYHIIQMELGQENDLIIFGYENGTFQLGSLSLRNLKPLWTLIVPNVNANSKFLVHDNHIIVINECQKYCLVDLESKKLQDFDNSILRDMKVEMNKYLNPTI